MTLHRSLTLSLQKVADHWSRRNVYCIIHCDVIGIPSDYIVLWGIYVHTPFRARLFQFLCGHF